MAAPATAGDFLDLVRRSRLVERHRLAEFLQLPPEPDAAPPDLAVRLTRAGLLTRFQADQLLKGKWKGFGVGKYRILDRIGFGGMGTVFLAEHKVMRRRVALKVLPLAQARNPIARERFYREARAAGALAHPNLVRAYDVDSEGPLHFLVMEYVDGASLHDIVTRHGPLTVDRAAHYLWQAAVGLHHAHEAGLVHRDIKPGNLILDRTGVVKILDLGLARFFTADDGLTNKTDGTTVLGTADYLAPEQAVNSHGADIRADVYALGATAYFLLTGKPPFDAGTVAQKLLAHQMKPPTPLWKLCPDVPAKLDRVVAKMLAKKPGDRFQTAAELAAALDWWARQPVPPPPDHEMPEPVGPRPGGGSSVILMRAAAYTGLPSAGGKNPADTATAAAAPTRPLPAATPKRTRRWTAAVAVAAGLLLTAAGATAWRARLHSAPPDAAAPGAGPADRPAAGEN